MELKFKSAVLEKFFIMQVQGKCKMKCCTFYQSAFKQIKAIWKSQPRYLGIGIGIQI